MFIVFDLEATCWEAEEGKVRDPSEIIQIGAVKIDLAKGTIVDTFDMLVRPRLARELSAYCTQLTGITTEDVKRAEYFEQVYPKFVEFCGSKYHNTLAAWGEYDGKEIAEACSLHQLEYRLPEHYINVAALFRERYGLKKKIGLRKAVIRSGDQFIGRPHNGFDDALNTARLFAGLLGVDLDVLEFC